MEQHQFQLKQSLASNQCPLVYLDQNQYFKVQLELWGFWFYSIFQDLIIRLKQISKFLNFLSLLNIISNVSPRQKISSLGYFTISSTLFDVFSEASVKYWWEYLDSSMFPHFLSNGSIWLTWCLNRVKNYGKSSLADIFCCLFS